MKIQKIITTGALLVAISTSAYALTTTQVREIKQSILAVPVPEMPAKAAALVSKASKQDREAVAVTAIRAVAFKHRTAAPLVATAISKAAPEVQEAVAIAFNDVVRGEASAQAPAAATAIVAAKAPVAAPAATPVTAAVKTTPSAPIAQASGSADVISGSRSSAGGTFPSQGLIGIQKKRKDGSNFPGLPPQASSTAQEVDYTVHR